MSEDQDRTGMTQVALSDEDRNERARQQAAEQVKLDDLYEKKRSHNRKWNEEIRQLEGTISQLAKEAEEGIAWVPAQTAMFEDSANDAEPDPTPPARQRRGRRRNGAEVSAA